MGTPEKKNKKNVHPCKGVDGFAVDDIVDEGGSAENEVVASDGVGVYIRIWRTKKYLPLALFLYFIYTFIWLFGYHWEKKQKELHPCKGVDVVAVDDIVDEGGSAEKLGVAVDDSTDDGGSANEDDHGSAIKRKRTLTSKYHQDEETTKQTKVYFIQIPVKNTYEM